VWHPNNKNIVLSSSIDGTIRLWDVNDVKKQKTVIKTKNQRGTRTGVQYGTYGLDGNIIVGACQDGSLQIFNGKGPFVKPDHLIREAHVPDTETSCVSFSLDGHTMITRGGDHTLKVWDLRNLTKGPVAQVTKLPNMYAQTDCIFSPDERYIVTGTSVKKDEGNGLLIFFDKHTLRPVTHFGMGPSSVIRILWHKGLNQIVVGGSDSVARVLYDPEQSVRGALMCVVKAPRKQDPFDYTPDRPIQTPHSLAMFKPEPSGKRKRDKDRKDPIKSRKPDLPTQGPGTGRGSLTAHMLKQMGSLQPMREEDPREAILKYAKEAEENPAYFGVYKVNQPKPIFNTEEEESAEQK
jgi:WD40 repeat protein